MILWSLVELFSFHMNYFDRLTLRFCIQLKCIIQYFQLNLLNSLSHSFVINLFMKWSYKIYFVFIHIFVCRWQTLFSYALLTVWTSTYNYRAVLHSISSDSLRSNRLWIHIHLFLLNYILRFLFMKISNKEVQNLCLIDYFIIL